MRGEWYSMPAKALLVLEDGTVFSGRALGAVARGHGEVVFSTAMTGYQEMLTEDRKSTRLNSSHIQKSRMPSSA